MYVWYVVYLVPLCGVCATVWCVCVCLCVVCVCVPLCGVCATVWCVCATVWCVCASVCDGSQQLTFVNDPRHETFILFSGGQAKQTTQLHNVNS